LYARKSEAGINLLIGPKRNFRYCLIGEKTRKEAVRINLGMPKPRSTYRR
jgi:hypothetical protein